MCIGATTYMENSATVSPLVFKHVRFTTCTGKGYKFSTVYMNRSRAMGNHLVMNVERQTWYRDFETYGTVYDMLMLG